MNLTKEEVKALNDKRIEQGHRDRAEDFAEEQVLEENDWQLALNAFVAKHSGASAIRADSLLVCKEANVHLILVTAKKLNLRPSVAALETAWESCKSELCDNLEDRLTDEEKDKIVAGYLCDRKGLNPLLSFSKLQKSWTETEWDAAYEACKPKFRLRAVEKNYKPRLDGERILPQIKRPDFPPATVIPDQVKDLTYKQLIEMKPDQQSRLMRIPGAKEHMDRVIDKYRKGSK
jgi:hypothetical protein